MSFQRKRESIISDAYKYLGSHFRGNDNYLRMHHNGCPSVSVFEGCELLAIYYLFYACYLVLLPF